MRSIELPLRAIRRAMGNRLPACLLLALYPLIWFLDLSWWNLSPDVVIVSGLLPLAWVLARRATNVSVASEVSGKVTVFAASILVLGILMNQLTIMAIGWSWLAVLHLFRNTRISAARLFVLCMGAFPWVLVDANVLGWFFRMTGASLTGDFYEFWGFEVLDRGTLLEINGLPISVEAACSGMQLLQVLMSGGIAFTFLKFPKERSFWAMLLLLPALAWFANTIRILVISGWALAFGIDSASGAFHTWGAIVVLASMLVCYLLVSDLSVRLLDSCHDGAE